MKSVSKSCVSLKSRYSSKVLTRSRYNVSDAFNTETEVNEINTYIQVAIIATSNTPLNIIIQYIYTIQTFSGATFRPHQDLYTKYLQH